MVYRNKYLQQLDHEPVSMPERHERIVRIAQSLVEAYGNLDTLSMRDGLAACSVELGGDRQTDPARHIELKYEHRVDRVREDPLIAGKIALNGLYILTVRGTHESAARARHFRISQNPPESRRRLLVRDPLYGGSLLTEDQYAKKTGVTSEDVQQEVMDVLGSIRSPLDETTRQMFRAQVGAYAELTRWERFDIWREDKKARRQRESCREGADETQEEDETGWGI